MKIILLIMITCIIGCSKSKDDNKCWECEKTIAPYSKVEICDGGNTAPTQHTDGGGNTYTVKNCKR
jgi:hypothetical protein